MHADPARRYASVDLLREDLEHHLQNRPVSAHPGGVLYRTRKFIARHRTAVAACVLVLMSLAAGADRHARPGEPRPRAAGGRGRGSGDAHEIRTRRWRCITRETSPRPQAFFREAVEHGRRMPQIREHDARRQRAAARAAHPPLRTRSRRPPNLSIAKPSASPARSIAAITRSSRRRSTNTRRCCSGSIARATRKRRAARRWRCGGASTARVPTKGWASIADAGRYRRPPGEGRRSGDALSRGARARPRRAQRASCALDRP